MNIPDVSDHKNDGNDGIINAVFQKWIVECGDKGKSKSIHNIA